METGRCGGRSVVVPTMMVLYGSDAVDVRYSDGSLLQLSPCGSSMCHHDPPSQLPSHPLAVTQGVQKWTQFVTSAHKVKVLQAVDFRNRFAVRPFLSPTLLPPDDIVSLYTRVDQIAWARTAEESHMEVLEDGSRRVVSLDEYASVVLSPHGQDFTVCYLSHVSPESVGNSTAQQSPAHLEEDPAVCCTSGATSTQTSPRFDNRKEVVADHNPRETVEDPSPDRNYRGMGEDPSPDHNPRETVEDLSSDHNHREMVEDPSPDHNHRGMVKDHSGREEKVEDNPRGKAEGQNPADSEVVQVDSIPAGCQLANPADVDIAGLNHTTTNNTPVYMAPAVVGVNRTTNNSTPMNVDPMCTDTSLEEASGLILADGTVSTPGQTPGRSADLQSSAFSVHHDISSISRVSTPDGLRGMVDCDDTLTLSKDNPAGKSSVGIFHSSPLSETTQSRTGQGSKVAPAGCEEREKYISAVCMDTLDKCIGTEAVAVIPSSLSKSGSSVEVSRVAPTVKNTEKPTSSVVNTESRGTQCTLPTKSVCAEQEEKTPSQSERESGQEQAVSTHQCCIANPQHMFASQIYTVEGEANMVSRSNNPTPCSSTVPHSYDRVPAGTASHSQDRVAQSRSRKDTVRGGSGSGGGRAYERGNAWSGSRQHYTWVTQHISCNTCPPAWRHPLRLLQHLDPSDSVLASECNLTVATHIARGLQKRSTSSLTTNSVSDAGKGKKHVLSSVVSPVPLTCPFQHLHRWQDWEGVERGDDGDDGPSALSDFQQGQLKVLMMEGVVFRFIDVANLKTVEIYPGDGSVLVSQGTTASYFSHLTWKNGKLEEKMYSVKMLPPKPAKAPYSLPNLIRRAHRLLTGCLHYSRLSEREDLPCWKRSVTQIVEPLSASLLEETCVAGWGRFQAFSNGHVRVVFEDRTSLDTVADFSQRLHTCLSHSSGTQVSMEERLAALKSSSHSQPQSSECRLLLPNAKYVMVDIHKPGPYRRYVDAAKEWIQWVQSSPKERRQFYQDRATPHSARQSAEAELKKIECFNYIVDHSTISSNWEQQRQQPAVTSSTSSATCSSQPSSSSTALRQSSSSHVALHGTSSHQMNPVGYAATLLLPDMRPSSQQSVPHHHSVDSSSTSVPHGTGSVTSVPQLYSQGHRSIALSNHGYRSTSVHHSSSVTSLPHHEVARSVLSGSSSGGGGFMTSAPRDLQMLQGFSSVREALLRTSQMIREIDDIVRDHRESGAVQ